MFNLDQIQSHLKSPAVTQEQLIKYVQNPNGQVPSVLALAELKRREELKTSAMPPQGAQPTVADQVVASAEPQQAPQGISGLALPETMYDEKNYASGGIVAFDDGGDVGLKTRSRFDTLTNEEKQIIAAQYGIGADIGNQRGSVGAEFAGIVDGRGASVPRSELRGRYMTDQGNEYNARYMPDARALSVDRNAGRTSLGADVAPGPDNSMGLRSIRGSYITDNGTRYGAGYNVDSRRALLERINQEGNSLGITASPDSVGVQGQYGFAHGGEVKHYVGGDLVQSSAPAEDLGSLSLSDLTPEQYSRLTTDQLANLQQIERDRQRLGRLGKGALGVLTAPYQMGAYGYEKLLNAAGLPRVGKALGVYDPDVTSVRVPRIGISDVTKPIDVSKEALAKEVAQNAADKKMPPKPELQMEAPKSKNLPADVGFTGIKSEKIKGIGDYAKELEDYVGPDKSKEGRDARLAKMEARAKDMEDKNAGMSMLTAGLDIAGGTSPYALVNLARGKSGVEQYQKTQDKLADLEEKRYQLITDAEKADRQEKLAFAKYGADAKQTKEAQAHTEKMQNNLLKNQWNIAKYNNDIELIKASAKGGLDANQTFTAKQKLLDSDEYSKWEAAMVDKYGESVLNNPDFPNQKEKWLNEKLGVRATTRTPAANTSGYTITPH
jgi:hypothetical protein